MPFLRLFKRKRRTGDQMFYGPIDVEAPPPTVTVTQLVAMIMAAVDQNKDLFCTDKGVREHYLTEAGDMLSKLEVIPDERVSHGG